MQCNTCDILPASCQTARKLNFLNSLEMLAIPKGVKYIGQKAFFQCIDLESILIPKSVTDLNGCATFLDCKNLKEFRVQWEIPVTAHPYLIEDMDAENCTLVVPKGSKPIYEATEVWKDFKKITEDF